jgi:hypothetical protein
MSGLYRPTPRNIIMWCFGLLGDVFLVFGVITAVKISVIAGFTPVLWFLLAIICYIVMILIITLRIYARLENQQSDKNI